MEVLVKHGHGKLQQQIMVGKHTLISDVPEAAGGEDAGPEPHDLLAAALGSCTALTVTMYARRKGWDLQDIEVQISQTQLGGTHMFTRQIRYVGNLSDDEKARLTEIANKCPVHKTLSGTIQIVTEAN
ncbi:OsmC family protein [Leeia oryzae]|uniref:OsmC family protein n=1 Tax=Leeia oryzae TaxID=356662 RepID=UPI0003708214|nr:OsmC family protein [Leeia oryzae]